MTSGGGSLLSRIEPGSRHEASTLVKASILALAMVLLDQLTKFAVVKNIAFASRHAVIPHFFNLTYITNTGAAWGIFSGRTWLLLAISMAVLVGIVVFLGKLSEGWPERYYGLLLVGSGIVGNCIDRVFRGEVVDFLQFYAGRFYWPSFNVADSCITAGVLLFIISSIFRPESGGGASSDGVVFRPK